MEIQDKHEITDDEERTQFAAVFYLTEEDVALIHKFLDMALITPAAKFHKDWHRAKLFNNQLKNSLRK